MLQVNHLDSFDNAKKACERLGASNSQQLRWAVHACMRACMPTHQTTRTCGHQPANNVCASRTPMQLPMHPPSHIHFTLCCMPCTFSRNSAPSQPPPLPHPTLASGAHDPTQSFAALHHTCAHTRSSLEIGTCFTPASHLPTHSTR